MLIDVAATLYITMYALSRTVALGLNRLILILSRYAITIILRCYTYTGLNHLKKVTMSIYGKPFLLAKKDSSECLIICMQCASSNYVDIELLQKLPLVIKCAGCDNDVYTNLGENGKLQVPGHS